jgi:hypothetical protein
VSGETIIDRDVPGREVDEAASGGETLNGPCQGSPLGGPKRYRSTSLKLASKHCPRALDHMEAGDGVDRRQFEVGTAAHAVLQAVGEATAQADRELTPAEVDKVAGATAAALLERGRSFDGKPEPPLSADGCWQGRDLALRWLALRPEQPGARFEIGLAVDAQWRPVPYGSPLARYRTVIDRMEIIEEGDEESAWRVLVLRDYKSAWSTDAGELDTLQLRGHAVMGWISEAGNVQVIRREVVNLRTMKLYGGDFETDLQMGDEVSLQLLRRWRDDLQATMDGYDRMAALGRRPAVPGAGCSGCPYLFRCADALDYIERAGAVGAYGTAEERARGFAVASAVAAGLKERLQADTQEAPVDLGDAVVGTVGKPGRELAGDAYSALWESWQRGGGDGRGFAKALKLGVGNAEQMAKALFPARGEKPMRDDLLESVTAPTVRREFGIHRKNHQQQQEGAP